MLSKFMFWKKTPLQSHDDRIEEAQKIVADALESFEKVKKNLEAANDNLDTVIAEARADVDRATATINNAEVKKTRNNKLHTKFADLTSED